MNYTRRSFISLATLAPFSVRTRCSKQYMPAGPSPSNPSSTDRFDTWIEVEAASLRYNTQQVARLSGGRSILAVVKNNAYGLGLERTAQILAGFPEIAGFAAVKADACIILRDAGIEKPILLMGLAPEAAAEDLAIRNIQISVYTDDAIKRIAPIANSMGRPIQAHYYLDTGMGRMGMPYHRALPWMAKIADSKAIQVVGTYMAFTEEQEFDREQLRRFQVLAGEAAQQGIHLGQLHAASSNGVFHLPDAHLDLVRPGIALYGAYPSRPEEERQKATLRPAFRLKCRVVRVVRLRPGDSVSYGRHYVAEHYTWIATLPVGHADGYPRKAVEGGQVQIGDRLYPVIGAVSASHTIVELGEEKAVNVGDVATLIGPDHTAISPNALADMMGVSVYDVIMHLNPQLPRVYL